MAKQHAQESDDPPNLKMHYLHNTDLNPSDDYLRTAPHLKEVLRDAELLKKFRGYDDQANAAQRRLLKTGKISLALAAIALSGTVVELLAHAAGWHVHWLAEMAVEFCALVAVVLAAGPKFAETRAHWLTARYMTEQMRTWHFQLLLDGELVLQSTTNFTAFIRERAHRWARLLNQAATAEGDLNTFVDSESPNLHFAPRLCPDPTIASELFHAYRDLRIVKQLSYFKLKKEQFAVRDDWSEAVAKYTLFSAILISAAQLLLLAYTLLAPLGQAASRDSHGASGATPAAAAAAQSADAESKAEEAPHPASLGVYLLAVTLFLVVINAAVRVYRGALAVSIQREHYEAKWVRLLAIQTEFDAAPNDAAKLAAMKQLEIVELEELRYFLRYMRRASFLL